MSVWPQLINPKISVVICNYNYESYIEIAINSVLAQTYQPYEIIVVDDGSTDGSVVIVKELFPNVKLISKQNEGQISAYNSAMDNILGDVVLFLDSDDELMPDALEIVSKRFSENIVKVQYKLSMIDKYGVGLNAVVPAFLDSGNCGNKLLKKGIMYKSPPASGNVYRVEALRKLFPLIISKNERHGADYFCIYGISPLGMISSINQPLFRYRIHDTKENISKSLGFGNALKKQNRYEISLSRWETLNNLLVNRLGDAYKLPDRFIDFTQQKYFYALAILSANSFKDKFHVCEEHFFWLIKAIFVRTDFNIMKKLILTFWGVSLVLLPHKIAEKVASKVCNPV